MRVCVCVSTARLLVITCCFLCPGSVSLVHCAVWCFVVDLTVLMLVDEPS